MSVHVMLCNTFIWFCNHLDGEEGSGCCALIVFLVTSIVLWLFLMVPWIGLRCAIVVFLNQIT